MKEYNKMIKRLFAFVLISICLGRAYAQDAYQNSNPLSPSEQKQQQFNRELYRDVVRVFPETKRIPAPHFSNYDHSYDYLYFWLHESSQLYKFMSHVESKDWSLDYVLEELNDLTLLKQRQIRLDKPIKTSLDLLEKYEAEGEDSEFDFIDDTNPLFATNIASYLKPHGLHLIHLEYENNYFIVVDSKEKALALVKVLDKYDYPAFYIED
ncbi:hypothetical protein EC844_10838 [Acinetobacter calcoaceticus]|uniref:Uncharacterized protein n=1 Tax=Acinetobacter calcoaceticus TaxID=471 RepID=A0A4R1XSZ2_ACICA|nr:hypothetical protein EC844_10838 [Acinetobacter calcoaceticus]